MIVGTAAAVDLTDDPTGVRPARSSSVKGGKGKVGATLANAAVCVTGALQTPAL